MKRFVNQKLFFLAIFAIILFFPSISVKAHENVAVTINQPTIIKGYTLKSRDNNLIIGILPKSFKQEIRLTVNDLGKTEIDLPKGKDMISDLYEFDFKYLKGDKRAEADFLKPFTLILKYDSENESEKNIYFFNGQLKKWSKVLPAKIDAKKKIIEVKLKNHYAQVAILEEKPLIGMASWYKYKACLCAASPVYPKGSRLKVTNVENGKSVVVRVNDFGPDQSIFPDRVIDLDLVAFKEIARSKLGLAKVKVEKLSNP